jgi:hypothetical protein
MLVRRPKSPRIMLRCVLAAGVVDAVEDKVERRAVTGRGCGFSDELSARAWVA